MLFARPIVIYLYLDLIGEIFGEFSWPPRGKNGFGYDPIFYYPKLKKTFGELDPIIKHKISHRNLAFKKLKTEIKKIVHG